MELGDLRTQAARARAEQLALERTALEEEEAAKLRRELLAAVEATAAGVADDPADRLFAEDTARGLKLVQLLSRRYDVAVMNPPSGAFVPRVRGFVETAYPLTSNNIYAAFIDRACQLTEREGYVGALVSSTFANLKSFERLRTEILLKRNPLILMLDLGPGILDGATVSPAAIAIHCDPRREGVSPAPVHWRWEEQDFGFRFRVGSGPSAAEHYQAAARGDFYVVPANQRRLPKARADALDATTTPPTAPPRHPVSFPIRGLTTTVTGIGSSDRTVSCSTTPAASTRKRSIDERTRASPGPTSS